MGFRQLVFGSSQVYTPHTQNSQTGSSLPVDLYLRVGDFLPKLSGRAYNAMKHPWSGATFGNICFRITRFLQHIRSFNHALGLLMHEDAKYNINS